MITQIFHQLNQLNKLLLSFFFIVLDIYTRNVEDIMIIIIYKLFINNKIIYIIIIIIIKKPVFDFMPMKYLKAFKLLINI